MHWLIEYRFNGEDRHLFMRARTLPHIKAVAFSIYVREFPEQPRPLHATAEVESWLGACGITISDVSLAALKSEALS
ncbi:MULTISPECIES: hypothetical protein [unclassified Pseudomonas]|uniref:hypothetical protein n=1 Tax=unclassified Pseudomonas TaxID=196821 RepID=UPI0009D9ABF1|nr:MULTISPECIES: hypothetical protein [unclassified Pseudomonas]MBD9515860.1 hypothetical protein [Pseudomonas sp. PDM22]MBD9683773.1 hypothetical protein [Pseudomonas sp. PDM20]OQR30009.1 hypothetical protein BWR15_25090 [Pseudomonas sp. T]